MLIMNSISDVIHAQYKKSERMANNISVSVTYIVAMALPIVLTVLAFTLSTPQLAVASECGIVVVQEEELTQNIRDEVNTALVSLLRATWRQPPAVNISNESEIELRAEIRKDVNAALEQTMANVTDVCDFRDEINELKESVKRDLREVKESVKRDLRELNATTETVIEAAVNTAVEAAVEKATRPIEQLLQSLVNDVALLRPPGTASHNPATSCKGIKTASPASPSGYYWLRAGNGSSIRVYCDMTRTCGGITGGWVQVANIDMTNSSHTCPQGLKTLTSQKRLCGINIIESGGCSSAMFPTHGTEYTHVCGKVIGYQKGATGAFYDYNRNNRTIDDNYVSGVSLTHGRNPRKHIWTLAAGVHEGTGFRSESCPCTNTGAQSIPAWVGQDYFCDTGVASWGWQYTLYPDDPLWDGRGCGPTSSCCSFNNPPWFSKQLPSPTTDDIEMRLCGRTSSPPTHNTPVEMIELYVQ